MNNQTHDWPFCKEDEGNLPTQSSQQISNSQLMLFQVKDDDICYDVEENQIPDQRTSFRKWYKKRKGKKYKKMGQKIKDFNKNLVSQINKIIKPDKISPQYISDEKIFQRFRKMSEIQKKQVQAVLIKIKVKYKTQKRAESFKAAYFLEFLLKGQENK